MPRRQQVVRKEGTPGPRFQGGMRASNPTRGRDAPCGGHARLWGDEGRARLCDMATEGPAGRGGGRRGGRHGRSWGRRRGGGGGFGEAASCKALDNEDDTNPFDAPPATPLPLPACQRTHHTVGRLCWVAQKTAVKCHSGGHYHHAPCGHLPREEANSHIAQASQWECQCGQGRCLCDIWLEVTSLRGGPNDSALRPARP